MKFEFGKKFADEVSETQYFTLKDVTIEEMNAVRRTILAEVKCLGFGNVQFISSSSSFPEEMIKRRIEAIYVKNPDDTDTDTGKVDNIFEGQTFTLEAKCPKGVILYEVMSSAIPGLHNSINQNILITSLKPGQEIKIKFELVKGTSMVHNHWSVASVVGVDEKTNIPVGEIKANHEYEMFIETTRVFTVPRILIETCDILVNQLQTAKVKDEDAMIRVTQTSDTKIIVTIPNNHHTISKMISCRLLMNPKVYKAASIVPDPLKPNSEVHISAERPLEKYHEVIENLQDIFNSLRKSILSKINARTPA